MDNKSIFLVEDDIDISYAVSQYLARSGFILKSFLDASDVIDSIKKKMPSLVLVDLMLPNQDGITLCGNIREFSTVPIIIITAKTSEKDRLLGFNVGVDDYVCKPFSIKELLARVKAVIHRSESRNIIDVNKLVLYANDFSISYNGQTVHLTLIEFKLLELMHSHPGRIYSRQHIIDRIYNDYRVLSDRTVDSHIRNLRKKLADLGMGNNLIHSIYGAGYKYSEET